jgi:hypothetical protein
MKKILEINVFQEFIIELIFLMIHNPNLTYKFIHF